MDFNLSFFYSTLSYFFPFILLLTAYIFRKYMRIKIDISGLYGEGGNVRGKNRNDSREEDLSFPDNRRMTKAQRCLITLQLALIITLARRAFSDVYPVIKLDLLLLASSVIFSFPPSLPVSSYFYLFVPPPLRLIRVLSRCSVASES